MHAWRAAAAALVLAGGAGCAARGAALDPAYAATPPQPMAVAAPTGSIYAAGTQPGRPLDLFADVRARAVGDLLTIVLLEETTASKAARSAADKSTDVSLANPTLLGSPAQFNAPGIFPLASNSGNGLGVTLSGSRDFDGGGSASQSNRIRGAITVTVAQVLPNGDLRVAGQKLLHLTTGDEWVRIAGIVRAQDIGPANTVPSTAVADAQITYAGSGQIADSAVMGWLARFFTTALWPF